MNPFVTRQAAEAYLARIPDLAVRDVARARLGLDEPSASPAPVVYPAPQPAPSAAPRVDEVRATLPPPRPAPPTAFQAREAAAPSALHTPGQLTLALPWPPSINHYWRHILMPCTPVKPGAPPYRVQVVTSKDGKQFRAAVGVLIQNLGHPATPPGARLGVTLTLRPPNLRVIDIDNRVKSVLDALTHAHVWADDSLIDELRVTRGPVVSGGRVDVVITPLTTTLFEVMP